MTPILAGLFVFVMRVTDMSLDTLRLLFVMRGRKLLASLIGAIQATVFILAVSAVLSGPLNVWTVLGYTPGRFPKTEAFELPFSGGRAEPASRAFQEFVEKHAMDEFKDVQLLTVTMPLPIKMSEQVQIDEVIGPHRGEDQDLDGDRHLN